MQRDTFCIRDRGLSVPVRRLRGLLEDMIQRRLEGQVGGLDRVGPAMSAGSEGGRLCRIGCDARRHRAGRVDRRPWHVLRRDRGLRCTTPGKLAPGQRLKRVPVVALRLPAGDRPAAGRVQSTRWSAAPPRRRPGRLVDRRGPFRRDPPGARPGLRCAPAGHGTATGHGAARRHARLARCSSALASASPPRAVARSLRRLSGTWNAGRRSGAPVALLRAVRPARRTAAGRPRAAP